MRKEYEMFVNNQKIVLEIEKQRYLLERGNLEDKYLYFGTLDSKEEFAHFLDVKGEYFKKKKQIKIPISLKDEVKVAKKIDKFDNLSELNTILTSNGMYEVSKNEVVIVLSSKIALVEKNLKEGKIGFYLKNLKDGSIIEEVIPNDYFPEKHIGIIKEKEENVVCVVNSLGNYHKYTIEQLHDILEKRAENIRR